MPLSEFFTEPLSEFVITNLIAFSALLSVPNAFFLKRGSKIVDFAAVLLLSYTPNLLSITTERVASFANVHLLPYLRIFLTIECYKHLTRGIMLDEVG